MTHLTYLEAAVVGLIQGVSERAAYADAGACSAHRNSASPWLQRQGAATGLDARAAIPAWNAGRCPPL